MHSLKKALGVGIMIGMMCMAVNSPVMVQGSSILDEVIDTDADYAESTEYPMMRASCLSVGTAKISKLSSNSISVYGLTQCHKSCDNVYLSLFLERKVDGYYSTYKSWDFSTKDATNLTKSLVVSVPSGYYYRLRGYHAASDSGSDKESTSTLSSGIYVG